jgi:hypothetical protein
MPTVLFFNYGVFDQYDYWTGTVSLFVFAMMEVILYSWVFGMDKGWFEIRHGADINISIVFKYILKYVTPVMLIAVFLGALITPEGNDWNLAFSSFFSGHGWPLDNGSIIRQINNAEIRQQIAAAQLPEEKAMLTTKLYLITGAKTLLLLLFIGIAYLVYIAGKRRKKEGRIY